MRRHVAAAVIASLLLPGCDVQLTAEQITVRLEQQGASLLDATGRFRGGEMVITVENYTGNRRRPVLVETDLPPEQLPDEIVEATSAQADDAVVAVGGLMQPAKATIVGFEPVTEPSVVKLHVYLKPGSRYLLVDGRGGHDEGLSIELMPASD